ncbi:hypothetical protein P3X46_012753 [Hevea brasiliensis]|uniref:RING-type E3 ubiquitin transferase n=1 Tax=Hevea brasiliensis TaxID=3981 RepID=A0ABQ9MCB2_HEVBR|nr:E3 ubiquitin-protein ligase RING1 [Hevea brasiliensis]KAJ9177543.1 hypothetical protein P3X46_012753 [Hevea brasiliensis]KAJ9177544.1 hypothetical protein P3X46_012753 [Hevea brasiliensis]
MDLDPDPARIKIGLLPNNLNAFCAADCDSHNIDGKCNGACFQICPNICKTFGLNGIPFPLFPRSQPPPQPPVTLNLPTPVDEAQKHLIATAMIIMGCLIGGIFIVCILCAILRARSSRQRRSRSSRSGPPLFFGTQADFLDEDQGPEINHPTWFIRTVGLQQSVIDSISVFKYKKDEGLIEGTECSVCLNEFQEDESLRLLPKCSHAFHIPCIDAWLRSHKNCPLCRAPIVCDKFEVQIDLSVPNSSDLNSRGETQIESSENNSGLLSNQLGEDGTSEVRNGDDMNYALPTEDEANSGNSKMGLNLSVLRNHSRVKSDLVDRLRTVETEMQPMGWSVSTDSSADVAIYNDEANVFPGKHEENLDVQILELKYSKLKNVSKRGSSGNLSFGKLAKSSSIGHALQKGPISMKRSFSSSGKSSSCRHSRSQDSILPL